MGNWYDLACFFVSMVFLESWNGTWSGGEGEMREVWLRYVERQTEPVELRYVKPFHFSLRTKESFEGLLSNLLTWLHLSFSNITMAATHKMDWDREVAKVKARKIYFYFNCRSPLNSSDLEINENVVQKEHLMLEHIWRIQWSVGSTLKWRKTSSESAWKRTHLKIRL